MAAGSIGVSRRWLTLRVNVEVHSRFGIAVIFPILVVMPAVSMLRDNNAARRGEQDYSAYQENDGFHILSCVVISSEDSL